MVIWYLLHFLLSQLICQLSSLVGKNNSRRSLPIKSNIQDLIADLRFVHICRYNKVGSSSTSQTREKAECELVPGLRAMFGISCSCGQRWYLPPTKPRSGHLVRDPLALKTSSGAVYPDSSHCNVHDFLPRHYQI